MRMGLALALAAATLAWAGGAQAAETAAAAACRASPSAKAAVVERLPAGTAVDTLGSRNGWTRVRTPTPRTCWITTRALGGASAVPFASSAPRKAVSKARRVSRASSARSTRSRSSLSGGSCPCGSGRVCVGPRGGRYCMTSGGNKRYGM